MRFPPPLFLALALLLTSPLFGGPQKELSPDHLPEFVARYEDGLRLVEQAYAEVADAPLPLRDEWGQARTRRPVEDRRLVLVGLRQVLREFEDSPLDLARAIRLLLRSEALEDDLFDLSQIAYDHEREELGRRLGDVQQVVDHHNHLIESYVFNRAGKNQQRLEQLEEENAGLRKTLADHARGGQALPARQP